MYSIITYSVWRLLGRVGVAVVRVGGAYTVLGLLQDILWDTSTTSEGDTAIDNKHSCINNQPMLVAPVDSFSNSFFKAMWHFSRTGSETRLEIKTGSHNRINGYIIETLIGMLGHCTDSWAWQIAHSLSCHLFAHHGCWSCPVTWPHEGRILVVLVFSSCKPRCRQLKWRSVGDW